MLKEKSKLWLWIGIGAAAAVLLTVVLLLLLLPKRPEPQPEKTVPTTVETLPPPSENDLSVADFAYVGDYLTCLTKPSVLGIDVSNHQGDIDWAQVKAAGVEFVMLRLGYRGTDLGGLYEDERVADYYEGAKAQRLKIGAYFFSQAITVEEALEEAAYALEILEGWELDLPLVFDWEHMGDQCRTVNMDPRTLTDCALAFCQTVQAAGKRPMIYFNPIQARERMYLEELTDYGFWLAMYSDEMTFEYRVDMWQYTCTGIVPGIEGDVDINLYFPPEEG